MNSSYEEVARVQAGNGYRGDLHEFVLLRGNRPC